MMIAWPERPGLRCLVMSLVLSLAPLMGLLWMRRDSDPVHPRTTAAALGTLAGAFGWVFVDLWCPVSHVPHLLIGHLVPLLLTIAASVLLAKHIVMLRPRRTDRLPPAFVRSTMSKTELVESGATSNVNIMRTYATRVKRDRPGRDDGTRVLEKRESAMSD